MGADGSGQTRLTNHPGADYDPTWAPDSRHIAFTSDRCGSRDVWIMNADGTGLVNVTQTAANDWSPAWRP